MGQTHSNCPTESAQMLLLELTLHAVVFILRYRMDKLLVQQVLIFARYEHDSQPMLYNVTDLTET